MKNFFLALIILLFFSTGCSVYDQFNNLTNQSEPPNYYGTWVSANPGQAIYLFGQFKTPGDALTTIYEQGDMELMIDKVEKDSVSGTMRISNFCASGFTTAPVVGEVIIPKTCVPDSGTNPIKIPINDYKLEFGTVKVGDITADMSGAIANDVIYGTMTIKYQPYGDIKGTFMLQRQK